MPLTDDEQHRDSDLTWLFSSVALRDEDVRTLDLTHNRMPCTFAGIFPVDAPRSENEVSRLAKRVSRESHARLPVQVCVPQLPQGKLVVCNGVQTECYAAINLLGVIFGCVATDTPNMVGICVSADLAKKVFRNLRTRVAGKGSRSGRRARSKKGAALFTPSKSKSRAAARGVRGDGMMNPSPNESTSSASSRHSPQGQKKAAAPGASQPQTAEQRRRDELKRKADFLFGTGTDDEDDGEEDAEEEGGWQGEEEEEEAETEAGNNDEGEDRTELEGSKSGGDDASNDTGSEKKGASIKNDNGSDSDNDSNGRSHDESTAPAGYCILLYFRKEHEAAVMVAGLQRRVSDLAALLKYERDNTLLNPYLFALNFSVGLSENDGRNSHFFYPTSKGVFKVRCERDKVLWLSFHQSSDQYEFILRDVVRVGIVAKGFSGIVWMETLTHERRTEEKRISACYKFPTDDGFLMREPDGTTALTVVADCAIIGVPDYARMEADLEIRGLKPTERIWIQGKKDAHALQYNLLLRAQSMKEKATASEKRSSSVSTSEDNVALGDEESGNQAGSRKRSGSNSSGAGSDLLTHYVLANITQQAFSQKSSYLERLNTVMQRLKSDATGSAAKNDNSQDSGDGRSSHGGDEDIGVGDDDDDDDDDDDGLIMPVSGLGEVDQTLTDKMLKVWGNAIMQWDKLTRAALYKLARNGVPDVMRNEVWIRLSGARDEGVDEKYRFFIAEENEEVDAVIECDLQRTFPAHDRFKEEGGEGQKQLKRVCHAYAIFDEEVGYVQGLSFIAAVLLLHLPEEMAFAVLVMIMKNYRVRDLYLPGFDDLQLRFYQLGRLIEDTLPTVHAHFTSVRIEPHMYAPQWFLTLYATKFPLPLVFRVFDILLASSLNFVFKFAIALLKGSRKELVLMEFDEILAFFRHDLPALYAKEDDINRIIREAAKISVTDKMLVQYERDFILQKAQELEAQDPITFVKKENESLKAENAKLNSEVTSLSSKLIAQKNDLEKKLDRREKQYHDLQKKYNDLDHLHTTQVKDMQAAIEQHQSEIERLKDMCRSNTKNADDDRERLTTYITEMETRHLTEMKARNDEISDLKAQNQRLDAIASLHEGGDEDVLAKQQQVNELEVKLAEVQLKVIEAEGEAQALREKLAALTDGKKKRSWFNK